jgi:hypothetical protein
VDDAGDITPNKSCERSLSKSPSPVTRVLEKYVDFGKHSPRKPLFLNSEQVELLEERRHNEEERMQKAQRYNEVLRNNEKKYAVGKTWKESFEYDSHKNIW